MLLQLRPDRAEVYRVLNDSRVVRDAQLFPVDWVREDLSLLIATQCLQHAEGGLLPVITDRGRVGYLWNFQLADGLHFLTVIIQLEVWSDLRILSLELFELLVREGRVVPALAHLGQHVALGNLALVDDGLWLGWLRGLRPALLGSGPTWILHRGTSTLKEEGKDLVLALTFRPRGRADAFLVLTLDIGTLVDEELDHLVAILRDSVVDRTLVLRISLVYERAQIDEQLRRCDVPFSDGVVNWRLSILVLPVDVVFAFLNKVLHGQIVTITARIEQGSLLESIISAWAHAHLGQHLDHAEGQFMVRNCGRCENRCLAEFVLDVKDNRDVDVVFAHHVDDFFDLAFLDLLKESLMQWL